MYTFNTHRQKEKNELDLNRNNKKYEKVKKGSFYLNNYDVLVYKFTYIYIIVEHSSCKYTTKNILYIAKRRKVSIFLNYSIDPC